MLYGLSGFRVNGAERGWGGVGRGEVPIALLVQLADLQDHDELAEFSLLSLPVIGTVAMIIVVTWSYESGWY